MKTRKILTWLLFISFVSACRERYTPPPIQTAAEQAASKAHKEVLVPNNSTQAGEDEFTFPIVWLTPVVGNLNLRAEPDTSSEVVHQIQIQDRIKWTGNVSDHQDKISIRGNARSLPWLQVTNGGGLGPVSWVYSGGVRPFWIDFGYGKQLPDSAITNRWMTIEPVDSIQFIRYKKGAGDHVLMLCEDKKGEFEIRDSTPIRISVGGGVRVFHDLLSEGQNFLDHTYVGQQSGWHIIARGGWESGDFLLVRSSDGAEFPTMGNSAFWPLTSPSNQFWAFPSRQDYEYGGGIEILNPNTRQSFMVTFSDSVEDIIWATDQEIYFKTSDEYGYSTSYHRLKFSQLFN